jgi:hypothetical protein
MTSKGARIKSTASTTPSNIGKKGDTGIDQLLLKKKTFE